MPEEPAIRFPTTHWSLLARARDADPRRRREALEQLLRGYWTPIKAYLVARRGLDPNGADDVAQGFIVRQILECNLLTDADPRKGRFRALLVAALDRFLANVRRDAAAGKRGAGRVVSLDELSERQDPGPGPDRILEAQWAREVLGRAVARMRADCGAPGRPDLWGMFEGRVLGPAFGSDPVPYERLVAEMGLETPAQASNLLVTAKRMFVRSLRQVVAEYESDDRLIDEEIADLQRALALGQSNPAASVAAEPHRSAGKGMPG